MGIWLAGDGFVNADGWKAADDGGAGAGSAGERLIGDRSVTRAGAGCIWA